MPPIDGLVLADKPAGPTSHDIVRRVQRIVGADRAGHTGTLDPMASGLLVILLGAGTRLARFVPDHPKTYLATISFGAETDTDDATGTVIREAPAPAAADVRNSIASLTGPLQQRPPAYSARKVEGKRAYSLARRGTVPQLAPAPVHVDSWEVLSLGESSLTARVRCSRGTYIRALARDLGRMTNSAAHLAALRREASGPFHVADAVTVEELEERAPDIAVRPLLAAIPATPRIVLDAVEEARVRHGATVDVPASGPPAGQEMETEEERVALVDANGRLIALARREHGRWQPDVVLVPA